MRILHKLYARLAGYFWEPCALCGREFGGHEIDDQTEAVKLPARENFRVVCGSCSNVVRVANLLRLLPPPTHATIPHDCVSDYAPGPAERQDDVRYVRLNDEELRVVLNALAAQVWKDKNEIGVWLMGTRKEDMELLRNAPADSYPGWWREARKQRIALLERLQRQFPEEMESATSGWWSVGR